MGILGNLLRNIETRYCSRCARRTDHSKKKISDWANSGGKGTVQMKTVYRCNRCGKDN